LLLNEYLSEFMHFETIFFVDNDFFKPTRPTKEWKIPHFFETFPYSVYWQKLNLNMVKYVFIVRYIYCHTANLSANANHIKMF